MSRSRPIPQLVVRAHDPRRGWRVAAVVAALWAASLVALWYWGGARVAASDDSALRARIVAIEEDLARQRVEGERLKEQLAVSQRADQVSRTANEALQQSLRDSEEEIAGLRADLAFYQRLVAGKERRGLTVHDFRLSPIGASGAFAYEITLTQNLKKGAVSEGEITLAVEGVRDGKLVTLDAAALSKDAAATPVRFSFKYFQKLDGSVMLPAGFTPNRVMVRAQSRGGDNTEQAFAWSEALAQAENGNVRQ